MQTGQAHTCYRVSGTPPRACIISLTKVVQEPRVLRQISTLTALGWTVAVVGYSGGVSVPSTWEFLEAGDGVADRSERKRIRHLLVSHPRAALIQLAAGVSSMARINVRRAKYKALETLGTTAMTRKWSMRKAQRYFESLPRMRDLNSRVLASVARCDLVIAHDYYTYILADNLARRDGARLAIDCHEYAMEQYNYDKHPNRDLRYQWRFVTRPYVDALQHHFFHRADAVSTVCDGIADLLAADCRLSRPPAVVRSTPFFEDIPFRPCGERIEIVYHGLVTPTRNLDVAVRTLALCRPEFHLTIRGPVEPGYDSVLSELAKQLGVQDRFVLAPPVPFSDLVRSASEADIGYFLFENFSRQRQFTAPNKFFEYMMAGLALVVSDVPELARVIRTHDNGRLVGDFAPGAIAAAINGLDREAIDNMKRRSLAAARVLCWENEQQVLIDAYRLRQTADRTPRASAD